MSLGRSVGRNGRLLTAFRLGVPRCCPSQDQHAAYVDLAHQSKKFQVQAAFAPISGAWSAAGEALRGVPLGWESSAARMAAYAQTERANALASLSVPPVPPINWGPPSAAAMELHALPKVAQGASLGLYGRPN